MRSELKRRLSMAVKKRVMRHYLIPFSETGLEGGLVRHLSADAPINLIDVGASSGLFTRSIESYCGIRNALLVEPQPARVTELRSIYQDGRFTIEQCAVSDAPGSATMDVLAFDYASSLLPIRRDNFGLRDMIDTQVKEKIEVKIETIDALTAALPWLTQRIGLLKLDVQGGELLAFKGARHTLEQADLVWTELSFRPLYEGSALFADIHSFLTSAGFIMLSLSEGFRGKDQELLQGDALFSRA